MTSDRAIAERQSRLEILQQLNAEGEGLAEGSQAVLRGLDDPAHISARGDRRIRLPHRSRGGIYSRN
jgi:hypothetical protein